MDPAKLNGRKFAASFSGGKDSVLSIYRAARAGGRLEGLITTVYNQRQSSFSHCISKNTLFSMASLMNTSLDIIETDSDNYRHDFIECLRAFRGNGIEFGVFGDIDLQPHRDWIEGVCGEAGMTALFPLWQEKRENVVEEFIREGFRAVIKVVNLKYLDTSYLGRQLDSDIISEFKAKGIDVCGENGEYHTFVYDGPLFSKPYPFKSGDIIEDNGYGILTLE